VRFSFRIVKPPSVSGIHGKPAILLSRARVIEGDALDGQDSHAEGNSCAESE
jgi:hypothetical protein